jgi:nucleoside-diphosphate-sugar epimerase
VQKARRLLGWQARVELRDGLEQTVAWLRERGVGSEPAIAG